MKVSDHQSLGNELKQARQARGMTQGDAAKAMEMARTSIVAIEQGDRKVSAAELIRFAEVYGRSVSDWMKPTAPSTPLVPQFRAGPKSPSVGSAEINQAVVELESIARDYKYLEELTERPMASQFPPEYSLSAPGVSPEQRGEEVANSERSRMGFGDSPISDLRSLLEDFVGLRIFYLRLPSRVGGLYAFNDELGACIAINILHPPYRSNWSLCHEFGHFLTTRYSADVSFWDETHWGKSRPERFADAFAKCFLMPRSGINSQLTRLVEAHGKGVTVADVMTLAHLYRVSAEAIFRRLEELKRLPRGTWDGLRKQGFKPDKAKVELGHSDASRETMVPMRFKMLAWIAFEKMEELTEGQLAKMLRCDRVSARLMMEEVESLVDSQSDDGFDHVEADLDRVLVQA